MVAAAIAAVLLGIGIGAWAAVLAVQAEMGADPGVVATGSPSMPASPEGTPSAPAPSALPSASAGAEASTPPDTAGSARDALMSLHSLATVSGHSEWRYDRDLFGQRWADVDRNGCDTRNDILGSDLSNPVFKPGTNDCKVLSGQLLDPYTGETIDFVSGQNTSVLVQIDHVVALGWAWRHGADVWSDETRVQFANDPMNLVAAIGSVNQSKSASGPSEWLPDVPELRCAYVERFVGVLDAYGLGINAADRATSEAVLARC